MSASLSTYLNFWHWFAAFLVVIGHVRHLVLVDFKDVAHKTLFSKGIYFMTGLGHEAVVLFFVISGFLVGGLTLARWRSAGAADLRSYSSARFSRIYVVLIPALFIGLALDSFGLGWFNASELYTNSVRYQTISLNNVISDAIGWPTFLGNLLMMQGILVGSLGSNGPLWSLSYEWWYYCLFALSAAALTDTGYKRVGYAVFALVIASLLPVKLLLWGVFWVLGAATHAWIKSSWWRPHPVLGNVVLLLALAISRLSHNVDNVANRESLGTAFFRDLMLAVAFAWALASVSRMTTPIPLRRLHEWLADFSYSTYLFHFPAMLLAVAVGYQVFGFGFRLQPGLAGLAYFLALTIALYLYCFGCSLFTERYTNTVRKRMHGFMGQVGRALGMSQHVVKPRSD